MLLRHLHNVHALLSVLAQPTAAMQRLREVLCEQGRFPTRRTWERRFQAIPATLPAQIGCLGRHLLDLIQPWVKCGRAVAIDSTILRAVRGWLEPWIMLRRYWSGWSALPPPPVMQLLLQWLEGGHSIAFYSSA